MNVKWFEKKKKNSRQIKMDTQAADWLVNPPELAQFLTLVMSVYSSKHNILQLFVLILLSYLCVCVFVFCVHYI